MKRIREDLERLRSLQRHDWDGEGAAPITDEAIAAAEALIGLLLSGTLSIGPCPDGSVDISVWDDSQGNLLMNTDGGWAVLPKEFR